MAEGDFWYKDTIIYELHVKAFFDGNNDGIGDFQGLEQKLDYLRDLGVGALWLLPFYPSPLRDDGYDISDYRNIHPAYGTLRDFRSFLGAAHDRGLKVVTELVINHTSDQHPWFKRARQAKAGSVWRDYYVWSDTDQKYKDARIIFTDTETSNWAWDPEAKAYYWHRFFSHQPDLNFDNPRLVKEIARVMRFWLEMGVDGFRLDAIPYLVEREGTNCENLPETHAVIKRLRAALNEYCASCPFLAEANQWPEDVLPYFGEGDECQMAFHFPLMPRLYMAIAQEDRHPVTDIMRQTPEIPANCQWAIFLRNHDELTLEMVTDSERDYLWQFYANDLRARLNIGIRRRLAPLLENDRRKVELLYSLLMSMPGTPIIYYGDEIGMGDNVFLGDRDGVRTPMQWTPDRNGGFSRTDPARLYLPPIMDPIYGYEARNVEAQSADTSSLLNWLKRLIAVRQRHRVFGHGTMRILYPGNRKVFAYLREDADQSVLCIANLSRAPQPVELHLSAFKGRIPIELLGRSSFPPIGELPYFITLAGYGFYWFLLAKEAEAPSWHAPSAPPIPDLVTLVAPHGWDSIEQGEAKQAFLQRILPEFLPTQRWFGGKGQKIAEVRERDRAALVEGDRSWRLGIYEVAFEGDEQHRQLFSLPKSIKWSVSKEDVFTPYLPWTLAKVRQRARVGILIDGAVDENLARAVVRLIEQSKEIGTREGGVLKFWHGRSFAPIEDLDSLGVERPGREQSNTSLRIGDRVILKFYRRLQPGIHPEIEVGIHLTDTAAFANTPATLGAVEYVGPDGSRVAIGVLQKFVQNQGEGWQYAVDYLDRLLEQAEIMPEADKSEETNRITFMARMRRLGQCTAEMHRAFAVPTDDEAFRPEPVQPADIERWTARAQSQFDEAFAALTKIRSGLTGDIKNDVERLMSLQETILERLEGFAPRALGVLKSRCHSDFHLGQVVLVQNDFSIFDFEGEPIRSLEERREKRLPLIDVAGMLRSFDYATWASIFKRTDVGTPIQDTVLARALEWERETSTAFLAGYDEAIEGCLTHPAEREDVEGFLKLFGFEKACYEICYEAAHRPDWLRIPVRGALRLAEQGENAP